MTSWMQIRRLRPRSTSAERIASSSHWCSMRAISGSSFVAQSLTRWNFGARDRRRRSRPVRGAPAVSATALSKSAHQYALMSWPCSASNLSSAAWYSASTASRSAGVAPESSRIVLRQR